MSTSTPVAFVTGASRGIGRCGALALAEAGYDLVLTARTLHEGEGRGGPTTSGGSQEAVAVAGSLETTAREVEALGRRALVVRMDLMDRASVEAACDTALDTWGRVDVLFNNAIYQGPGAMDRFLDLPLDAAQNMLTGNYLHQIVLLQRMLPHLLKQERSYVINMTSGSASMNPPGPAGAGGWGLAYAASKAAFARVAGVLHAEFHERGLRAFNVDPGHILTEAQKARGSGKHLEAHFRSAPAEVPGAVIGWLASAPEADAYRGEIVRAQKVCKDLGLVPGWPEPRQA
ncbi:SDR family NAD(P)-dependent oxidoreductase [Yinghuangia seranimata]|uniref:SDR family NAD(P)-dependent oxidoreductase n=1 Tax=Yinghuangia seranimata TaxID=408067 RepID=UPI00248AB63F|nr:SDR family oxidoreductase [Yinghuangia seranimata]MDI2126589.1 SDR family oxidoreductase [Yinghuangia seranimata]